MEGAVLGEATRIHCELVHLSGRMKVIDIRGDEVIEGREKPISEAAEVLLKQLEQLKVEEKELKSKIKEQKTG